MRYLYYDGNNWLEMINSEPQTPNKSDVMIASSMLEQKVNEMSEFTILTADVVFNDNTINIYVVYTDGSVILTTIDE